MGELNGDYIVELVSEWVYEEGEKVFDLYWDSGGPGAGADNEIIYLWHDLYWLGDSTLGLCGPYESFEEALEENELLTITSATESIPCDEMSTEALLKRIVVTGSEPDQKIKLNYEEFVIVDGKLKAVVIDDLPSAI